MDRSEGRQFQLDFLDVSECNLNLRGVFDLHAQCPAQCQLFDLHVT